MESQLLWIVAAAGLGIGLLAGFALARRRSQQDMSRVHDLEDRLAQAQTDHAEYRTHVSQHFVETSRRLHDLTVQYKSVYEHLADGARALCPEGAVAIAPSLAEAALPETASAAPEEVDEAQLDLELDAPGRWATADREHDLGPILDEETPPPPKEAGAV